MSKADKNNDGKISKEEMAGFAEEKRLALAEEESKAHMEEWDKTGISFFLFLVRPLFRSMVLWAFL